MAIYDTIRDAETQVTVEVLGKCMSAAVPIAQACEQRLIHPNATVMVHNGTWHGMWDSQSFATWGKQAKRTDQQMYEMLAARSHQPVSYWRRKCKQGDFIMSALEACAHGLFDGLIVRD